MSITKLRYLFLRAFSKLRPRPTFDSTIDSSSKIGPGSRILSSKFGRYSYCGSDCLIINCDVGAFCSIADNVVIGPGVHPIEQVSTSPVFLAGRNVLGRNISNHAQPSLQRTRIGNDVWIGLDAKISSGVVIGDGAIIGMGSVVTKDVEPYAVVGGVPAHLLRYRFDKDIIKSLLEIRWWDLKEDQLVLHAKFFKDPRRYLREYYQ